MAKNFFATDPEYKQMASAYNKTDAAIAIGVFALGIVLYAIAGYLYSTAGITMGALYANIIIALLVIAIVRIRKQKLNTVGFTRKHFKKALILGLSLGALLALLLNIIPAVMAGRKWTGIGALPWNFFTRS